MKQEKLLDAIGMVGEDLIVEAKQLEKKRIYWKPYVAVAACLVLIFSVFAIAKPFQSDKPDVTAPDILQRDPITIPFTSPSEATVVTDPTVPQNPTDPPIQQDPTEPTYDPGPLMQLSASPENGYIGNEPTSPGKIATSLHYNLVYIEAHAVEILPDIYTIYSRWYTPELRIIKMKTTFSFENQRIPNEFYLLLHAKFLVDLTQYDTLVLPYMCQCGPENSVLYNITQGSAVAFDLSVFSSPLFDGGPTIYAFNDGSFDESLWTINDVWTEDTKYTRENGTEFETLEEIRTWFYEDYGYGSSHVKYNSDLSFKTGVAALEYIKPFENGVFILLWNRCGLSENFTYQRYINGIPTNEYIHFSLHNKTVSYSGTAFTQDDMDSLPDVASAIITVEDAFQAELIPPPHIVNYKDMELRSHGVTGWYFKANDKVYGVVQVNFTYYDADEKESRYDDIYFLIEPSSETCVEISRDELLQLQGTNHFIYTHEYDENGKVPGNYIY